MKQTSTLCNLIASLSLGATAFAADTFTQIDFPGATATQSWGITPRGDIVGNYTLPDKSTHGFLLSGGRFATIDYPNAAITLAEAINAEGDIVGEYGLTTKSPHHAFLLTRSGVFKSLDYPGATSSFAVGINSRGEILGGYVAADMTTHGFVLRGESFTPIDYPGASPTVSGGINARGEVVGAYSSDGHAFLYSNGKFSTWDFPAASFTNATAINTRGEIVGRYLDSTGMSHAYLKVGNDFTSIDFPGATFTGATSILPNGDILGRCIVGGITRGFLLTRDLPREPLYQLTDLGPVGTSGGLPNFISDNGLIAGGAATSDSALHAALWYRGLYTDLTPQSGAAASVAYGVSQMGDAVGATETSTNEAQGESFCGFSTHNHECRPFLWQNGGMTLLPTLGGNNGIASFINNRGQISGVAETAQQDPSCPAPQKLHFKPVVWENGHARELPTFGTDQNGFAFAINDSGAVVGTSGDCATLQPNDTHLISKHALLWQTGTMTDLGTLGGAVGTFAYSIDNQGEVVGASDLPGDQVFHAFLWSGKAGMQDLGTLPGDVASVGFGINAGEVVGISLDPHFNPRAVIWQHGAVTDMNTLIPSDSPFFLLLALSINARGQVVGNAVDLSTGVIHGFMATPLGKAANR